MSTAPTSNADLRARLFAVEAEISEHRRHLKELESHRRSILDELGRIVYPVLSLPNEITTEIFLQSLPNLPGPHPNVHCFPLTPLSVCRAWRALAISTPRLWVRLGLNLCSARLRTHLSEIVDDWFSRAGSHLSTLIVRAHNWKKGDAISDAVRPILHRHGLRLQAVDFQMTEEQYNMLADVVQFPLLEDVTLDLADYWEYIDSNIRLFSDTPRLTRLTLGRGVLPHRIHLPYQQLDKLVIKYQIALEGISDVLRDAANLRHLHCSLFEPENASTRVEHLNLRTLTLGNDSSALIFPFIRFPALQNLVLFHQWLCQ
ncbi:hypothetical protein FB45DRAFT_1094049 [Roridomyces roridus]|uniref:F-box domain-containing protein n=1 Tax=Roridomyces roridus TaxID=1738132 RepID=A0AAD7FH76_9AGAR|nr:hypothetical protein FB45DRAFT_1094049 [Roridomyces roridus]